MEAEPDDGEETMIPHLKTMVAAAALPWTAWATTVTTGPLTAELEQGQLLALENELTETSWLGQPTPIYEIDTAALSHGVRAEALPDGQLLLSLELTNEGATEVEVDLTFPALRGIGAGQPDELGYLFPARATLLTDQAQYVEAPYGALFPLQFMEVHEEGAGGLWVMTRDPTGQRKAYGLQKNLDDSADLVVGWFGVAVAPGETVTLEVSVGAHASDWHAAFTAYRRWLRSWFRPAAPRNAAFRRAFNLRQIHLHENGVLGEHPGAFDPGSQTYALQELLAEDVAAFGGVDWVHLFDWGMDWIHGRVGDYNPWSYLGDPRDLQHEIDALQDAGIGVGLYVEGYLLDTTSLTGLEWGDTWVMHDAGGQPYTAYAPSWHVCPALPEWQEHFATYNARRNELRVGASGLYVDQFGYGYQYPCHRAEHVHAHPTNQVAQEAAFLRSVREALSPQQVIYTEAFPADVTCQVQDGAFTEAVVAARWTPGAIPVNVARFALPDVKTFELLTQDAPLADDVEGVRLTFFNGEGIRLMGYLEDDPWFEQETLDLIAHTWGVLSQYEEAFSCDEPTPAVETRVDGVWANRFHTDQDRLWTLYNGNPHAVSGIVLAVDDLPGATWRDCWNDVEITPSVVDGLAQVETSLGAGEVGCVVQRTVYSPAALVAHWPLDEQVSPTVADATGHGATGTLWPEGEGPELGQASAHEERFGTAAWFDGIDDSIALGEPALLAGLTGDFSIAAWVYAEALDGVRRILATQGWYDGGWVFGVTNDGRDLVLTTVGEHDYVVPAVLQTGRWMHLAVTVDAGASATFYVDGEVVGTMSHDHVGTPATSEWWLGSNGLDGFWSGGLDDVRVYSGTLSGAQVRALSDTTPPFPGSVRSADEVVRDPSTVELWWPGFHDPESGLARHHVSVGTVAGAEDVLAATDMGAASSGRFESLQLPDGTLHVTVVAENDVGLATAAAGTFVVDTSAPELLGQWTFAADVVFGEDAEPVEVPAEYARSGQLSVSAWVEPHEIVAMTILGGDHGGWAFGLGGDGDDLQFRANDVMDYVLQYSLPVDLWSHVAVVFDRWTDVTFYVDGELAGVVHGAIPAHAFEGPMWIGGDERPFQGRLNEVRLFDGELDAQEVWELYSEPGDDDDSGQDDDDAGDDDTGDDDQTVAGDDSAPQPGDCQCGMAGPSLVPTGVLVWLGWLPAIRLYGRCRRSPPRSGPPA